MKGFKTNPVVWALLFFLIALTLMFVTAVRVQPFLTARNIELPPPAPPDVVQLWPTTPPPVQPGETPPPTPSPFSSLGPLVIYFASAVLVLTLVLLLVPVRMLKTIMRLLYAFLFGWGVFMLLIFWLPAIVTLIIAIGIGVAWFLITRVWLHNFVMITSMAAIGVVFGRFIPPWTALVMLLLLGIYDFLAVRFGYMLWMVKKLSNSNTLPAFVLPRVSKEWNAALRDSKLDKITEEKPSERDYSILGGGDIGFPLLLVASSYFAYGFPISLLMAGCAFLGLVGAYVIQAVILKGKPMPGLPPIAAMSLIGLLLVRFVIR